MKLTMWMLCWTFLYSLILVNGKIADLSNLTPEERLAWQRIFSQANSSGSQPLIQIVGIDTDSEVILFEEDDSQPAVERYVFKQDINANVDWYVYEGKSNYLTPWRFYDACRGSLSVQRYASNLAGFYIYSNNLTSAAVGVIMASMTTQWRWFNGTKEFIFDDRTAVANGTQLQLGFESSVYYNDNTDFPEHNRMIRRIVQQMNMSIDEKMNANIARFLTMDNLSCKRHSKIVYNSLRALTFACMVDVVFKCPLETLGSSCWLEQKPIANLRLDIHNTAAYSEKTITVRIDN